MGGRMNQDLSCDHSAAAADLDFRPRPFDPAADMIPRIERTVEVWPGRPRNDR